VRIGNDVLNEESQIESDEEEEVKNIEKEFKRRQEDPK